MYLHNFFLLKEIFPIFINIKFYYHAKLPDTHFLSFIKIKILVHNNLYYLSEGMQIYYNYNYCSKVFMVNFKLNSHYWVH